MTQLALAVEPERHTNKAAIRAHFLRFKGQWISALELAQIGGLLSSRTRISDVRRELEAEGLGTIENRQRMLHGQKISEYKFTPAGESVPEIYL